MSDDYDKIMKTNDTVYDVVVIGGGASGTALLYTLAHYTTISKVALVEKYSEIGSVNSNAVNNSQTLHVGDIETNYSVEKATQVKPAAMMVARYAERLDSKSRSIIMRRVSKMILAVGKQETQELSERYEKIKNLFPNLRKLNAQEIERVEPNVVKGRSCHQQILGLFDPQGYAVDFGALAKSFVEKAKAVKEKTIDVFLNHPVISIKKDGVNYNIRTSQGNLTARVVIVDTDAYSLGFAKQLGYGKEFSLIPIAGSFYFTKQVLNGKVYTMQDARMPFAAAHGDPDMTVPNVTRFGPTARFLPVLESRKFKTVKHFFASSGLEKMKTWASFFKILLEPVRFKYLVKNLLYELPFVGKHLFVSQVRKIVPSLKGSDLKRAHGYGGMRLQRVDTNTKELLLGEGKIIGDNIIFNMTPSPGASVCLYNAMRDAEHIMKFLDGEFSFEKDRMMSELAPEPAFKNTDVSATTYVS
jgi:malate dehydrogenase (quinone)